MSLTGVRGKKYPIHQNEYPNYSIDNFFFENNLREPRLRWSQTKDKQRGHVAYMKLPYVIESICRRVNGINRGSRMNNQVAWQSGPTLKKGNSYLSREGLLSCLPQWSVENVAKKVYTISCKNDLINSKSYFYIVDTFWPVREDLEGIYQTRDRVG